MKKILLILLLILIVPQITLAVWWNPISWFNSRSFSTKTESKTEVLERRIEELENKLSDVTSTTTSLTQKSFSTTTPSAAPTVKKESKIITSENRNTSDNQSEDFSTILVGYLNNQIASFSRQRDSLNSLIVDSQANVDAIERKTNYLRSVDDGSELSKVMIEYYSSDVDFIRYLNYFKAVQKSDDDNIIKLNNLLQETIGGGIISKSEYQTRYANLKTQFEALYHKYDSDIATTQNNYLNYVRKIKDEISEVEALQETLKSKTEKISQENSSECIKAKQDATSAFNIYYNAQKDFKNKLDTMKDSAANTVGGIGGGYSASIQKFENDGQARLATLAVDANAAQNIASSACYNRTPTFIPPTQTNCQIYGNSVNCTTY